MHTAMVPEQVKTMKIQAGIQVQDQENSEDDFSFGRLHLIVFVLVRNIIKICENIVFTTVDCCSGGGGSGGGSVDVVLVIVVKLEGTSTNVVRALKKFVLCKVSTKI
nr:hypothetical protein [Tanacetum cinerariifolium]